MTDANTMVERLETILSDFDVEVAQHIANETERADLWDEVDVPVALVRQLAALVRSQREEIAALRKVLSEEGLTVNYQVDAVTKRLEAAKAEKKRQFNVGYILECCNLTNLHDEPCMSFDVLEQLGISRAEVKAMNLSEYDTKALRKIERSCPSRSLYIDFRRARAAGRREG